MPLTLRRALRPPPRSCAPRRWEAVTGDAAATWRVIGQMRHLDAEANTDWRVQRYWLDEVARVMPDGQKATHRARGGGSGRTGGGFASFLPGGKEVCEEDYELLGLASSPPPSSSAIRQAFRKQCMVWHPDLQQGKSDDERRECEVHFQKVVTAHQALRNRHPEYLDDA